MILTDLHNIIYINILYNCGKYTIDRFFLIPLAPLVAQVCSNPRFPSALHMLDATEQRRQVRVTAGGLFGLDVSKMEP